MVSKVFRLSILFFIILSLCINCSHIIHDVNVRKGTQTNILAVPGALVSGRTSPSYFQLGMGYGFHLKNGKNILPQINLTESIAEGSWNYLFSFDFYVQTSTTKPYGGWGLVVSRDPRLYFMWGNEWQNEERPNTSFAMSYVTAVGLRGSLNLQTNLTWHIKNFRIGPLMEYRYYFLETPSIENIDVNREKIEHVFMAGLIISLYPDSPK